MSKIFIRIVASLLVPCLFLDPVAASGFQTWSGQPTKASFQKMPRDAYAKQALVGALIVALFRQPLDRLLTAKLQASASDLSSPSTTLSLQALPTPWALNLNEWILNHNQLATALLIILAMPFVYGLLRLLLPDQARRVDRFLLETARIARHAVSEFFEPLREAFGQPSSDTLFSIIKREAKNAAREFFSPVIASLRRFAVTRDGNTLWEKSYVDANLVEQTFADMEHQVHRFTTRHLTKFMAVPFLEMISAKSIAALLLPWNLSRELWRSRRLRERWTWHRTLIPDLVWFSLVGLGLLNFIAVLVYRLSTNYPHAVDQISDPALKLRHYLLYDNYIFFSFFSAIILLSGFIVFGIPRMERASWGAAVTEVAEGKDLLKVIHNRPLRYGASPKPIPTELGRIIKAVQESMNGGYALQLLTHLRSLENWMENTENREFLRHRSLFGLLDAPVRRRFVRWLRVHPHFAHEQEELLTALFPELILRATPIDFSTSQQSSPPLPTEAKPRRERVLPPAPGENLPPATASEALDLLKRFYIAWDLPHSAVTLRTLKSGERSLHLGGGYPVTLAKVEALMGLHVEGIHQQNSIAKSFMEDLERHDFGQHIAARGGSYHYQAGTVSSVHLPGRFNHIVIESFYVNYPHTKRSWWNTRWGLRLAWALEKIRRPLFLARRIDGFFQNLHQISERRHVDWNEFVETQYQDLYRYVADRVMPEGTILISMENQRIDELLAYLSYRGIETEFALVSKVDYSDGNSISYPTRLIRIGAIRGDVLPPSSADTDPQRPPTENREFPNIQLLQAA